MSSSSEISPAAELFGGESVAAAAIFAALYVPLFCWFVRQCHRRPTLFLLSFFCAIRVTAFTIRATVLARPDSVGQNVGLVIADGILFGVGFFGLLQSAYTLALERTRLADSPKLTGVIDRLATSTRLFRLATIIAVGLGIGGASQSSDSDAASTTMEEASTIILLVLTVLQAYQTLRLAQVERSSGAHGHDNEAWGMKHRNFILCSISFFLLVRQIFATATMNDTDKQSNEHFWYPLIALPEVLAVALCAIPGLVPPRSELPT